MMEAMRDPARLIEAVWNVDDTTITLWYGKQVEVKKGDTIFYYQAPTQMMFVEVIPDSPVSTIE